MSAPPSAPSAAADPICPHAPACAGCALIGTAYTRQLAIKRERVVAALAAYPSLAGVAVGAMSGSQRVFGYRNQVKLVARRSRHGLMLGVYRPGTHQVVDISRCPVHDPRITQVLAGVRQAIEATNAPVYDERTGSGWLRYVVVRASAWKHSAQVILVVRDRNWSGEAALVGRLRRLPSVRSVALNLNRSQGNVIFSERFIGVTREQSLLERVGGLTLSSRAGAFLQANIGVARKVYERVLTFADPQPDSVAVDLYCGVGAISFYLASRAHLVFGVEESPSAVLDAKLNIRINGYHNIRFSEEPAAAGMARLTEALDRIDLVTLNPPRKGADEATRAAIARAAPPRIVYVSCEPTTLARDLDWFAARGWRTERVDPFDMLPQTEHVECVALLNR
ncbi:MAG TPA: 23S rRNA (uracil(1939)-C(5))-methyltransferase RlmD [Candidatus Dormibacteraeota bacterium]|nr:23S rRNA (uracil(1939)-C(5))-methyltransferase RlmD [Candidatus Dormibacteraeota bacterium]